MSRIEELEKEHEELRNKLDIAVRRREYIERKIFDSQYIQCTIEENAIKDIRESIDREFINAGKAYAQQSPGKVRGL